MTLYRVGADLDPFAPHATEVVLLADEVAAPDEAFCDMFEVEFPEGFPLHRFAVIVPHAPVGWRHEWLVPADVLERHATVRCGIPSPYA